MLQANTLLRERDDSGPFEDYSIFLYRQQAPVFNDRVKDLERKLLYPVSDKPHDKNKKYQMLICFTHHSDQFCVINFSLCVCVCVCTCAVLFLFCH